MSECVIELSVLVLDDRIEEPERDSEDDVTLPPVEMECVPECWYSEGIIVGFAVDTDIVLAGVFEYDRVTVETEGLFDIDDNSASDLEDKKDDLVSEYDVVLEVKDVALTGELVNAVDEDLASVYNEL